MEWIQPTLLWGMLGLSIPVLIHLWNGKKGKVIAWAAFPWLDPKESQSSRSVKLENWLLLLIRILLLTTLVFLLAGLIWKRFEGGREYKVVHLVWPDEQVEAEFRFELEQATQKGQEVRWLGAGLPDYQGEQISGVGFSLEKLQDYLDELDSDIDSIYLYTGLQASYFQENTYWLPQKPVFRIAENYIAKVKSPAIALESGKFLELDLEGILVKTSATTNSSQAISGTIPVAFLSLEKEKKEAIQSALAAIEEVYGLKFTESDSIQSLFLFSETFLPNLKKNQLLFLTENHGDKVSHQVFALSDLINLNWEETLEKGLLPELILKPILTHLEVEKTDLKISKNQLEQRFSAIPKSHLTKSANMNELFLILLVILFAVEHFLAYRANL
ncbi:putative membrane protein (TIGR02226 family) [Algoriphagus aquaeductus]|uniref:Putative membrane protein (TIGR02226 family) n=1 Tax=Algoriphagus aquaeductus TaxID=475299 RepID=A0A326RUP6_9BACT|nr:BatA domain-containing protein [Algoriphagus aquaeductus]PZV83941.1 putative membrane protein (TIGR02226 family) [Algoriphagus aquaeductus]